jgi:hypothetical protein
MLFTGGGIGGYCEKHTKHTNLLCYMQIFLNVKANGTHDYHCALKGLNVAEGSAI